MYKQIKKEISEIVSIVEQVPERHKDKCFELLLDNLIQSALSNDPAKTQKQKPPHAGAEGKPPAQNNAPMSIPAKVRAYLKRHKLNEDQLKQLVMMEGGEIHFIIEPRDVSNATGQIQWALLIALKSALTDKDFETNPEAVRSICQEKGLYDSNNWTSIFKRNKGLFRNALTPQGDPQRLSTDGEAELASLIQQLSG